MSKTKFLSRNYFLVLLSPRLSESEIISDVSLKPGDRSPLVFLAAIQTGVLRSVPCCSVMDDFIFI